jgi:hypothetical protein
MREFEAIPGYHKIFKIFSSNRRESWALSSFHPKALISENGRRKSKETSDIEEFSENQKF